MKDLFDDRLTLDTGDCLGFTSALLVDRYVNVKHTLQMLRPGHCLVALLRSLITTLMRLGTFATLAMQSSGSKMTRVLPSPQGVFTIGQTGRFDNYRT